MVTNKKMLITGSFILIVFIIYREIILGLLLVGLTCLAIIGLAIYLFMRTGKSIHSEFFSQEERQRTKIVRAQRKQTQERLRIAKKKEKEEYQKNTYDKQKTWE